MLGDVDVNQNVYWDNSALCPQKCTELQIRLFNVIAEDNEVRAVTSLFKLLFTEEEEEEEALIL